MALILMVLTIIAKEIRINIAANALAGVVGTEPIFQPLLYLIPDRPDGLHQRRALRRQRQHGLALILAG